MLSFSVKLRFRDFLGWGSSLGTCENCSLAFGRCPVDRPPVLYFFSESCAKACFKRSRCFIGVDDFEVAGKCHVC